jgi:hypothetical protein
MFDSCKDGGGDAGRQDSGAYLEAKLHLHQQSCPLLALSLSQSWILHKADRRRARVATGPRRCQASEVYEHLQDNLPSQSAPRQTPSIQ